ncbi:ATPase, V1 complex, subunit H [Kipferlia bialata]|uniref:ATPase, V1 complex, subunit H n=1 Tax=Kipferlia bialata TaxID=797122 RepID=A0A9K3D3B6_9EUKA|nr:ATPase, V1 complex, subunit H [Kipferlia bialata]|eukprot:g8414.t1
MSRPITARMSALSNPVLDGLASVRKIAIRDEQASFGSDSSEDIAILDGFDAQVPQSMEEKRVFLAAMARLMGTASTPSAALTVLVRAYDYCRTFPDVFVLLGMSSTEMDELDILPFLGPQETTLADYLANWMHSRILAALDPLNPASMRLMDAAGALLDRALSSLKEAMDSKDDDRDLMLLAGLAPLKVLLRQPQLRKAFHKQEGVAVVASVLMSCVGDVAPGSPESSPPRSPAGMGVSSLSPLGMPGQAGAKPVILYETGFVVWLISHQKELRPVLLEQRVLGYLVRMLRAKELPSEKLVRISLNALANLTNHKGCVDAMLAHRLDRTLSNLSKHKWVDNDLPVLLMRVSSALRQRAVDLTTWDAYVSEVASRVLEWTPPHKNEGFWRECVSKLDSGDFDVLRGLAGIVTSTDTDALTLCVAIHDIGQYATFHPRGRLVLDQTVPSVKYRILELIEQGETADIRNEAVGAASKLLVDNWQYITN